MKRHLRAASSAIGVKRYVLAGAVAAGVATYEFMRGHFQVLPDLPSWQIGTFVVLLLVITAFLSRIVLLEESQEPKLKIRFDSKHPLATTDPYRATENEGPSVRKLRIEVTNTGTQTLGGCLVKLDELRSIDNSEFVAAYVPIPLLTQHQAGEGRPGGRFDLRPGESKLVEVALLDERNPKSEIVLAYETQHYPNGIPRGTYEILLSAYGGPAATKRRFRLAVYQGKLTLTDLEEPNAA